jgi:hypothetical protein
MRLTNALEAVVEAEKIIFNYYSQQTVEVNLETVNIIFDIWEYIKTLGLLKKHKHKFSEHRFFTTNKSVLHVGFPSNIVNFYSNGIRVGCQFIPDYKIESLIESWGNRYEQEI